MIEEININSTRHLNIVYNALYYDLDKYTSEYLYNYVSYTIQRLIRVPLLNMINTQLTIMDNIYD